MWTKKLGYPFDPATEKGFRQSNVRQMYKTNLIVITCVMLFLVVLILGCVLWPQLIGPAGYIPGLIAIHGGFLAVTAATVLLSILLRRKSFERPGLYSLICNGYAVAICAWSSLLSAWADYSDLVFTAFIYVCLCASIVSLFKPWAAAVVFTANLLFYGAMLWAFGNLAPASLFKLGNAVLAAVLAIVIAVAFYRFRAKTYYSGLVISQQNEQITVINRQLRALVHTDPLTGLYNRRYFDEVVPATLRDIRAEGRQPAALMLDTDHFKRFNDRYGHQAGDICLRQIAGQIQRALRAGDTAVRYGGEEFFILAAVGGPGRQAAAAPQQALALAEDIRRRVEEAYIEHLDAPAGHVTVSVGVYCPAKKGQMLKMLAARADEALYQAKATGRNRSVLWTEE